jgi:hypothetical protein
MYTVEERQLEITIDNVSFRVDSKRGRLIEVENPKNQIKRQDLKDEGSWYRTIYDKKTRNIYKGWLEYGAANVNVVLLSIPKMLFHPTLVFNQVQIAQFRMECRRARRGFEVIGSKPALISTKEKNSQEMKTAAAERRKKQKIKK